MATECVPPRDRVSGFTYNFALSTLNEHLVMPSAPNARFTNEQMVESLVYLSVEERYAESGLEDLLFITRGMPSADTLLYRLKKLRSEDAHGMLSRANDVIVEELRRRGVLGRPVIVAIDLTDDPYYGEYNSRVRRSRRDRGTNLFYTYASIHVVENGRRITIFEVPVHQLDDHASVVERLIEHATARGIRIRTLLVDRGFYSVDVMNRLDELGVRYLMPAIKNGRIKRAIEDHHGKRIPNMVRFSIRNPAEQRAFFGLMIYPRKGAIKETDPIHERYIVFATNMQYREAFRLFPKIPEEYRRRWGIETGYRVQNQVKAKTTSTSFTVRLVYQMLSIILYNAWVLANVILAAILRTQLRTPIIKLTQLKRVIRLRIEQPKEHPP
jgi:Transposase DDE domain